MAIRSSQHPLLLKMHYYTSILVRPFARYAQASHMLVMPRELKTAYPPGSVRLRRTDCMSNISLQVTGAGTLKRSPAVPNVCEPSRSRQMRKLQSRRHGTLSATGTIRSGLGTASRVHDRLVSRARSWPGHAPA